MVFKRLFEKSQFNILVLLALSTFITGCIPVEDISYLWDKATLDPKVEGHWKEMGVKYRSQDKYISFVKEDNVYEGQMVDADYSFLNDASEPKARIRCLAVNDWGVFIIDISDITKALADGKDKQENTRDGGIQLYKLKNGNLHLYLMKDAVLAKAIKRKKIDGIIDENDMAGPRIQILDMKTLKYIIELANNNKNIERITKYERVQSLQKALKKSKEYPVTKDTPQNTIVDVNLPELKYFAQGKTDILLNQLHASPEWQVVEENDEVVCYRRTYKQAKWQVGSNGYESTFDDGIYEGEDFYQIRYLFRFSKEPYGFHAVWAKDGHVMKVDPEVGAIYLKLKLNDQGIMSYIAIGQKNLWFEFYEQRKKEPRTHTRRALAWLKSFLAEVKKAEKEIQQNGFAKQLLPSNSIKSGSPHMEIRDGFQGGLYTINAWINPQKSGYVYLKVFDIEKNIQLSTDTIQHRSKEYVGYSKNPNDLFSYNCNITVYEGDWNHFYDARFELWFDPSDGTSEVKLIDKTREICGWQR